MQLLRLIFLIIGAFAYGSHGHAENTPEVWSPENEYDNAQIITKRILYAFRLWIFRLTAIETLSSFMTLLIGVPILVFISVMMCKVSSKIMRKSQYWSNEDQLNKDLEMKIKAFEAKQRKKMMKHGKFIKEAVRQEYQDLK